MDILDLGGENEALRRNERVLIGPRKPTLERMTALIGNAENRTVNWEPVTTHGWQFKRSTVYLQNMYIDPFLSVRSTRSDRRRAGSRPGRFLP